MRQSPHHIVSVSDLLAGTEASKAKNQAISDDGTTLAAILFDSVTGGASMKRFAFAIATIVLSGTFATGAFAQDQTLGTVQQGNTTIFFQRGVDGQQLTELQAFNQIAAADPAIAKAIARHPGIVDNGSFVQKHPGLQQFLAQYPNAKEDIRNNPGNFVVPTAGSTWKHAPQGMNSANPGGQTMNSGHTNVLVNPQDAID
jgi:hypothetical protein